MTVPQITPLPPAPQRNDAPADFSTKADAHVAALPLWTTQANELAVFTDSRASLAATSADTASAKASEAESSATAAAESAVAAEDAAENLAALDQLWLGAQSTDPATGKNGAPLVAGNAYVNSSTGYLRAYNGSAWVQGISAVAGVSSVNGLTGDIYEVVTESAAQEVKNKSFSGIYRDKTYENNVATGVVTLDLSQADVFDLTLAGATALEISNAPTLSGETLSIVVRVSQGATAFVLTWFGGITTWLTPGGTAPATPAANKTVEYILSTMDGTNWIGRKGAAN